jgi:hypothetical protein
MVANFTLQNCFGCFSEKPKEQPHKSLSPPKSRSESVATPSVERLDRNILLQQLSVVWSSDLNMARDLPRLSSRVVFRDINAETNSVEVHSTICNVFIKFISYYYRPPL